MENLRVGILEDQKILLESLRDTLAARGVEVAVTASSLGDFFGKLRSHPVDIALVDLNLPEGSQSSPEVGLAAVREIRTWYPEVRVAVFSGYLDHEVTHRSLAEGAVTCFDKNALGASDLVSELRRIANGEIRLPDSVGLPPGGASTRVDSSFGLTFREEEVLRYVAAGENNLTIAAHLEITERTVRAHMSSLYRKLGSENRAQLAILGRQLGLKPPSRS